MRRRMIHLAAICLASAVLLLGFWQLFYTRLEPIPLEFTNYGLGDEDAGSDWIEGGEGAEDKAVVIAKLADQNTDWVKSDLKE